MHNLIQLLLHQFYTNQFMQAAVVAGPVAALSYAARSFPHTVWSFIRRSFSIDIQFNSDLPDYNYIQQLISVEIVNDRLSRRFLYSAEEDYDWENDETTKKQIGLTAGYGVHWGWFKNRKSLFGRTFVWIDRSLSEGGGSQTEKFKETINLTFLTRRKAIIQEFTKMVETKAGKLHDVPTVQLHINSGNWWKKGSKLPLRPISTVFTKDNQGQQAVAAIREFESQREWNLARGLPNRLGILLEGPPGTGKSSLLHAIASETGRSIFYLDLGGLEDNKTLTDLVSSGRNWSRSILVVEDIDATGAKVSRTPPEVEGGVPGEKREGITLSALLNTLDGLLAPDGLVVAATTNHPERLDPALIRAGRFDLRLHLGDLGWEQFEGMARLFDHEPDSMPDLKDMYRPTSGAKLRALLLSGGIGAVRAHLLCDELPLAA